MDASVMTVSMAGAEEKQSQAQQKPVFHDFLGICSSGHRGKPPLTDQDLGLHGKTRKKKEEGRSFACPNPSKRHGF
jgi:hypothetical protein